jgi:molecular chaperone GrpE
LEKFEQLEVKMISAKEELKFFKKKEIIECETIPYDLYEPLLQMENKLSNIDTTNKKTYLFVNSFAGELEEKQNEINDLKRELRNKENQEMRLAKKIANVLDQIDYLQRYVIETKNEPLIQNIEQSKKVIKKELRETNFEQIPDIGELFDPESHDCITAVESSDFNKNEIIDVIKKGYKYNGKVVRIASVIAVK